jgi:hypothetical protein
VPHHGFSLNRKSEILEDADFQCHAIVETQTIKIIDYQNKIFNSDI